MQLSVPRSDVDLVVSDVRMHYEYCRTTTQRAFVNYVKCNMQRALGFMQRATQHAMYTRLNATCNVY
jgi:hypothetical protein